MTWRAIAAAPAKPGAASGRPAHKKNTKTDLRKVNTMTTISRNFTQVTKQLYLPVIALAIVNLCSFTAVAQDSRSQTSTAQQHEMAQEDTAGADTLVKTV